MTLDIRGSSKTTKLSSNAYVVFEELISNAIDSYLIRKHSEPDAPPLRVTVKVDFAAADMLGDREVMSVTCMDNGCGLGDDQLKAFLTKDTSYKDDLSIFGIGKCKGSGRIQYFLHFAEVAIESTYRKDEGVFKRILHFAEPQKQIEAEDFQHSAGLQSEVGSRFRLDGFKEEVRARVFKTDALHPLFGATVLKRQMLMTFLQRLVSLDDRLGDFEICFLSRHWKYEPQTELLKRNDLPKVTEAPEVCVEELEPLTGKGLGTFVTFTLSHYRLDATLFDLPRSAIALCAKAAPVKDITGRYLRTRTEQNNAVDGFHHLVLIESDYLDLHVNEVRDDFDDIPEDSTQSQLFGTATLSYADIYNVIDPVITQMVVPGNWTKADILKDVADHFGINEAMVIETGTRVVYGEQPRSLAERVLKKYQAQVLDETAQIINLKEEILKVEPDTEEFRIKINELAWKYASSLNAFDKANLSQLIVRRTAIVEILDLATRCQLAMQNVNDGKRRKDEAIIHSIFFPMRKDSTEVADHDVWLLSEEYHYFDYIASDVPLANLKWKDNEPLFDANIDDTFAQRLSARAEENKGKRPDIAIFNAEGAAIILEFKAPGVSTEDHVGDLSEYAHLLAAKSGGKLKKFYCYLIGDTVNRLRLSGTWTPFATGKGWFQTGYLTDPDTRQNLGELYFEILHYSDVVNRAKKRISIYQEKLKVDLHQN